MQAPLRCGAGGPPPWRVGDARGVNSRDPALRGTAVETKGRFDDGEGGRRDGLGYPTLIAIMYPVVCRGH